MATVLTAATLGAPGAQAHTTGFKTAPGADPDGGRDIQLILDYRVVRTCTVHPNYPDSGVLDNNTWQITPADIVGWRWGWVEDIHF